MSSDLAPAAHLDDDGSCGIIPAGVANEVEHHPEASGFDSHLQRRGLKKIDLRHVEYDVSQALRPKDDRPLNGIAPNEEASQELLS